MDDLVAIFCLLLLIATGYLLLGLCEKLLPP